MVVWRSLTKEEMGSVEVIELLKQLPIPKSLQMLQQIQGEEIALKNSSMNI